MVNMVFDGMPHQKFQLETTEETGISNEENKSEDDLIEGEESRDDMGDSAEELATGGGKGVIYSETDLKNADVFWVKAPPCSSSPGLQD
ncbi:hypothetical protein U1Q18_024942 [Sarracenia purpurea var. burkii]